jgi:hypothetical protein
VNFDREQVVSYLEETGTCPDHKIREFAFWSAMLMASYVILLHKPTVVGSDHYGPY